MRLVYALELKLSPSSGSAQQLSLTDLRHLQGTCLQHLYDLPTGGEAPSVPPTPPSKSVCPRKHKPPSYPAPADVMSCKLYLSLKLTSCCKQVAVSFKLACLLLRLEKGGKDSSTESRATSSQSSVLHPSFQQTSCLWSAGPNRHPIPDSQRRCSKSAVI